MKSDKKVFKEKLQFILCKGIGQAFIKKEMDVNLVNKTIEEFKY